MMNFRGCALSCLPTLGLCALLASPAAASVTFISGEVHAVAYDSDIGIEVADDFLGTANATATALLPGFVSEATRIAESSGGSASFSQFRLGRQYDSATGYSYIEFTVDADVSYSLGGDFTNSSGFTQFESRLYDASTATDLFFNYLGNTASEPFTAVLGATNGNRGNTLFGSLTGNLLAGHTYQWVAYASSHTESSVDGAAAHGNAWLKFGEDPPTQVVPEPASIAVWFCLGLGAVGISVIRRRNIAE